MKNLITISLFLLFSIALLGQEKSPSKFRIQGDSRFTLVDKKSANIYGIRAGYLFNKKFEAGVGIYSSNLFGLLGKAVSKDFIDNSLDPPIPIPSKIGFHYFSIYGEYIFIENKRLKFTTNTQLGFGRVDIKFEEMVGSRNGIRESKIFMEHSIKADVQTFKWLRLIGGVGYRYLLAGEQQIKDAFNAPIYIIGFSIDYGRLFKKKK